MEILNEPNCLTNMEKMVSVNIFSPTAWLYFLEYERDLLLYTPVSPANPSFNSFLDFHFAASERLYKRCTELHKPSQLLRVHQLWIDCLVLLMEYRPAAPGVMTTILEKAEHTLKLILNESRQNWKYYTYLGKVLRKLGRSPAEYAQYFLKSALIASGSEDVLIPFYLLQKTRSILVLRGEFSVVSSLDIGSLETLRQNCLSADFVEHGTEVADPSSLHRAVIDALEECSKFHKYKHHQQSIYRIALQVVFIPLYVPYVRLVKPLTTFFFS